MPQGILELAKNTLLAQQVAMQVVGHNVANAQTEGYVRQVPVMEPIPGATWGSAAYSVGQGAQVTQIRRLQNAFTAVQLDRQAALLGHDSAIADTLSQVEAIFTEFDESGIADALGEMFASFEQIGTDPANLAARQEAVVRAQLVADMISGRQDSLQQLRTEVDQRLSDAVREANRLAQQIADLNKQIGAAGDTAVVNDLKSLRETAMSRLAELTGAYCIEQSNGQIDVMIGGRRMVQGTEVIQLGLELDSANPGMHNVCLGSVADPDGLGGTLQGLLDVRDGQIVDYISRLDTFAQTLADAVNVQHRSGLDMYGTEGEDFFTYDPAGAASSLQVSAAIQADPKLIAAAGSVGAVGDGSNASEIAQLRDAKLFTGGLLNAGEYYADLIGQMGTDAKAATDAVAVRETIVAQLKADYQGRSGVSLDEEAADLLRYQQVYNAAARLLQVSQQMMDALFAIS